MLNLTIASYQTQSNSWKNPDCIGFIEHALFQESTFHYEEHTLPMKRMP